MSASAAQTPAARLGARRAPTRAHRRAGCAPERTSAGRAAPSSAGPTRPRRRRRRARGRATRACASPPRARPRPRARGVASRARAPRRQCARLRRPPGRRPRRRARSRWTARAWLGRGGAHALTGPAWTFTTPSSTDGRKIVKAASAIANRSLASAWRKEDWEAAAAAADVRFLDTFSTLPGMRGLRVRPTAWRCCTSRRAQVLLRERRQGWRRVRAAPGRRRSSTPRRNSAASRRGSRSSTSWRATRKPRWKRRRAPRGMPPSEPERATFRGFREVGRTDNRSRRRRRRRPLRDSPMPNGRAPNRVVEARVRHPRGAIARWCTASRMRRCTPSSGSASTSTAQRARFRGDRGGGGGAPGRGGGRRRRHSLLAKAEWVEAMARHGVTTDDARS